MKAFLIGVTALVLGLAAGGMARATDDSPPSGTRPFDRDAFRGSAFQRDDYRSFDRDNFRHFGRDDFRRFDGQQFRRSDQDDFRRLDRNDFRRFDRNLEMPRPHHQGPRHGRG